MKSTATTNDTTAHHTSSDPTKGFWVRRTIAPVGIAAGLALALGLSACGTDSAVKRTTVESASAGTSVPGSSTDSLVASDTPADPGAPNGSGGSSSGGSSSDGSSSGGSSSDAPTGTAPEPYINSFWTPENIDCHNGNFQMFTATWETTDAHRVTISIDGPGVYAEYPADGEASLPFNCNSSHQFTLTAYGEHGLTATSTVLLEPRNVQGQGSSDDEEPMTSAKTIGQSSGTGPLNDDDCANMAQQQDDLVDIAVDRFNSGDVDGAIEAADAAVAVADNGIDLGCTFSYTAE